MSDRVYEVGASTTVTAWHVMPDVEGPESELHSHDYRIEAVMRRRELDDRGMVCDLDLLRGALDDAAGFVRGQNLEIIRPDDVEAVTVEAFARWVHHRLASALRHDGDGVLQVRVWETMDAFGGYTADINRSEQHPSSS
jgi:6-pyruvoyltetrahydropterin/6-carboxytetrahydropterin synthase